MLNNKIVVDLNKVQFGSVHYVNQYGDIKQKKPDYPTVYGKEVVYEYAAYHPDFPGETMLQRAVRLDILDKWTPICIFQLSANHTLTYTGEKAISMWKAFNIKIFKKNK